MASSSALITKRRPGALERTVAVILLLMMVVGSFALWIVIPAVVLRILMPISGSLSHQLFLALAGVPLAMVLFAAGLFWLNRAYLRLAGHRPEDDDPPRRLRGPLEPLLAWSFLLAFLTLLVWYLFLPHGPPSPSVI